MIDLRLGDCLELMKDIPDKSIDMILCDLPYGTTACKWDTIIPFDNLWEQYKRIIKDNGVIALFGKEPFSSKLRLSNLKMYRYDWIWKKERPTNIFQVTRRPAKYCENIMIFYKKFGTYNEVKIKHDGKKVKNKPKGKHSLTTATNLLNVVPYNDDGFRHPCEILEFRRDVYIHKYHPTQKPVELLEYLIKIYTNKEQIVLDNCMGSGSTAVACVNTGRNFIGIELDENYFKIAVERIMREVKEDEKSMFYG